MRPEPFHIIYNDVVVFHHGYLGLLLTGWVYPLDIVGLLILIDDVYEHTVDVRSPLRLLFDRTIYPILKKLEETRK